MKKIILSLILLVAPCILTSCLEDNTDDYESWRALNNAWLLEQETRKNEDGSLYYEKVTPVWNPNAYILMHWHNDRSLTANNLVPLATSYVDVKYRLTDYRGLPKDSSYLRTNPADSIYRSQVNANIEGWIIGLTHMHVGDSVTMVIPYQSGYGASGNGSIAPYSVLQFAVKLQGIPGYEVPLN